MTQWIKNFMNEEEGQGMSEYALVLGVVAVAVVAILITFRTAIIAKFQSVIDSFTAA